MRVNWWRGREYFRNGKPSEPRDSKKVYVHRTVSILVLLEWRICDEKFRINLEILMRLRGERV